jgi:hypothetical protein
MTVAARRLSPQLAGFSTVGLGFSRRFVMLVCMQICVAGPHCRGCLAFRIIDMKERDHVR